MAGKMGMKHTSKQFRCLVEDWTNRRWGKVEQRMSRILDRGNDTAFINLLKVIASVQPQKIELPKNSIQVGWPEGGNDKG